MSKVIEIKNVKKNYKIYTKEEGVIGSIKSLFNRKSEIVHAVDNISFDVDEGEFIGFIGPNGAGKTSTIKMLCGIIHPNSGTINVCGHKPHKLENTFKKKISIVMGQKNQLLWDLPAIDSFTLTKEIYQLKEEQYRKNLGYFAELFEVKDLLNTQVRNLSLGERMKMEIIAALLYEPKMLFLDEPTIGLDVFSRRKIREFLKQINKDKKVTIILTSHYLEDIKSLCSRIIGINKGQIVFDGSYGQISEEYADKKQVTITFPYEIEDRQAEKYGEILKNNNNQVTFQIKKSEMKEFGKRLFENEDITDFNVEDIPIDEVFENLFQKGSVNR